MILSSMQEKNLSIGVGIDIVTIHRIEKILQDYPDRFKEFAFTKSEQEYCDAKPRPAQHYASHWAIKEAYLKAISVQNANPDLASIKICREPTPHIELRGEAYELLCDKGTRTPEDADIAISMSHEQEAGLAVGILVALF